MPDIILKIAKKEHMKMKVFAVVILGMGLLGFTLKEQHNPNPKNLKGQEIVQIESGKATLADSESMPVYGNWRNFTTSDGLPGDKAYCVRIDGDRVLVGTHEGLAVYEQNKWTTYTSEDGQVFLDSSTPNIAIQGKIEDDSQIKFTTHRPYFFTFQLSFKCAASS